MSTHRIVLMAGDGHCLFRSIYFGLKEKNASHDNIKKMRHAVCEYIGKRWEKYKHFLIDYKSFKDYQYRMLHNAWGGEPEINALVQIIQCTIKIYDTRFKTWVKYKHPKPKKTIYLRYSGGVHYDCIVKNVQCSKFN